jgi:hypothetical protein
MSVMLIGVAGVVFVGVSVVPEALGVFGAFGVSPCPLQATDSDESANTSVAARMVESTFRIISRFSNL